MPALLDVRNLHTEFRTGAGLVRAVDGVSYTVDPGETVAIVGESGSGKSVGAMSILRLIPDPPGRITEGQILFGGRDLLRLSRRGDARGARQRDRHGVPGADDVAQSGADHRPPDHRDAAAASRRRPRDGRPARHRASLAWSASPTRSAGCGQYPAPALRRHAPAHHDRHRAHLRAAADHRRRADHGARRHDPGADPRADDRPDAPAERRADHHHAQSRRRRALCQAGQRHVRRPHRRERPRGRRLPRPAPSLHDGAAALGAAARPAAPGAARSGRGPAARPDAPRRRLLLPPALPVRGRRLRRGAARRSSRPARRAICRPASAATSLAPRRLRHERRRCRPATARGPRTAHALPDHRRHPDAAPDRRGEGGRRRRLQPAARRDPRPGGRERLRQDHDRPLHPAARAADRRRDPLRRRRHQHAIATRACWRCGGVSR